MTPLRPSIEHAKTRRKIIRYAKRGRITLARALALVKAVRVVIEQADQEGA
jgi:hypothetical protein